MKKRDFGGGGNSGVPRVEAYLLLVMTTEQQLHGEAAALPLQRLQYRPALSIVIYIRAKREVSLLYVPLNHLVGKRVISPRDFQNVGGGREEAGARPERAFYS